MQLQAIPETTLWTLYMRAVEAGRPDSERCRLGARRLRAPHGRGVVGSVLLPPLLYVLAIRF